MMATGLRRRLLVANAAVIVLATIGVLVAVYNQLKIQSSVQSDIVTQCELQHSCNNLIGKVSDVVHWVRDDPEKRGFQQRWDEYERRRRAVYEVARGISEALSTDIEFDKLAEAVLEFGRLENHATQLLLLPEGDDLRAGETQSLAEQEKQLQDDLFILSGAQIVRANSTGETLTGLARSSVWLLIAVTALFSVVGCHLLRSFGRHVVQPVLRVKEAALRAASGDLGQRLAIETDDEIGQLALAFNRMTASLQTMTTDLERAARVATRDLHQSEEKYRSLLQRAQEGILICDQGGFILEVNRQARKILGLVESRLYGQSLQSVFPAQNARVGTALRSAFRSGRRLRFLTEVPGGEAAAQWFEVSMGPIDLPEGRVVLIFLRDVTRQRRLEEQLVRSQRIKSVATLAGGLAHDYNNLLSPILGYTSYLRSLPSPDGEFADKLKTIEEAARRAADLSHRLQALARPRPGTPGIEAVPVDLNEVVQFAAKLIAPNLNAGVSTTMDLSAEPLPVLADATELQQIVLNLAINANDAMPDGGDLRIITRREPRPGGDFWHVVTVVDTGMGMRAEVKERIFDPFFTTKAAGKGCGLGLAMVHACVQRANGRIEVESEVGRGSVFRILLPATRAVEEPLAAPEDRSPSRALRVLLVDDDGFVRDSTRDMLQSLQCEVLVTGDGQEALALLRQMPLPDLAILDMRMAPISGPELLVRLRRFAPDLPVVFCSGYPESSLHDDQAARDPHVIFLRKPFTMSQLAQVLRKSSTHRSELGASKSVA